MKLLYPSLFLSVLLAGCAVGPDFEGPAAPETDSYTETTLPDQTVSTNIHGGETQYFLKGKDIPAQWWELFHSEYLNGLIEKAFRNNPTLQAAQAALKRAEEQLNISVANLFPFIDAQFTPERLRVGPATTGGVGPPLTFSLYTAQLSVTYTLDIFGGIRRQIESSAALVENQRFIVEAAYLTLASNVATAAIREASLRAQIEATEQLIASQQQVLDITKKKFALGGASQLEVLTQETQLEQNKATLAPLKISLSQTRNALSVLIGELPSESKLPTFRLEDLDLPQDLPVSVPSALIQQRPDIRSAEALLHSASAQVGVATAQLLPQVNINGTNYGWTANKLDKLFMDKAVFWTLLSNVIQPIFHGGALIANRNAAIDALEQAAAEYKQSVLTGFQNVADTLRALELDAEFLQVQSNAERTAKKALDITQAQYNIGAIEFVALLFVQRQYFTARILQIRAQETRFTDTVALFHALGGGWWNRPPPPIAVPYEMVCE